MKNGVLKNLNKSHKKTPALESREACPATLPKKDSKAGVFL